MLTATLNPHPLGRGYSTLEFDMNIELDEVVVQDVSDDALELAAGVQGGDNDCGVSRYYLTDTWTGVSHY